MSRTSVPLYAQTTEALRRRIEEKVWAQGDRLPSEDQLCREFGVSSITMRRAVATLVAEGLLVRLQGRGTFVSADHSVVLGPPQLTSFTQEVERRGWASSARVLSVGVRPASPAVGSKLGVRVDAPVLTLERVRLADDSPIAIQVAYLPSLVFPGLEQYDFTHESLYAILEREYQVRPTGANDTYRAAVVDRDEAALLDVTPSSPCFRVERITSDGIGRVIELVESVIRGDRYTLALRLTLSRQGLPPDATHGRRRGASS